MTITTLLLLTEATAMTQPQHDPSADAEDTTDVADLVLHRPKTPARNTWMVGRRRNGATFLRFSITSTTVRRDDDVVVLRRVPVGDDVAEEAL